jgi:hypothetical protein
LRVRLGSTSKVSAVKIVSFLEIGGRLSAKYQAVRSRKGVVISSLSVKTTERRSTGASSHRALKPRGITASVLA